MKMLIRFLEKGCIFAQQKNQILKFFYETYSDHYYMLIHKKKAEK